MNYKVLLDAFFGMIIGAGTGIMPLLAAPGVHALADIPQASLLFILIGTAVNSAKMAQSRLGDSGNGIGANGQAGFARPSMLWLVATLSALLLAGCATFAQNQASEKLTVQYAVGKVIEGDRAHMSERAARIVAIAGDAKSFFDTGTATIDFLADEVNKRIAPLNLSPADRLLVNNLLSVIVTDLNARVGNGVLTTEQRFQVSTVLGWVIDAAALYQ